VKAKEIDVRLTTQQIAVHVRGVELLNGQTFLPIRPDDSTWEIEAETRDCARRLRLVVSKVRPNQKWDCLFMHEVDESITHRVFMDITIGGSPAGRIVFGLHGNACPRTCENFRCLCTGERGSVRVGKKSQLRLHYKGTAFHKVLPGILCQGGDLTLDPHGGGGHSVFGTPTFDDENFKIKHTGAHQLLMANFGLSNNNHSQFAVTLARIKEFETRHVIFGKVESGAEVLRAMECEGSGDGKTSRPILISDCGELDGAGRPIEEMSRTDDDADDDGPVLEEQ